MSTRPGNKKIRRIDKNIIYNKYYMENNKQENKKKNKTNRHFTPKPEKPEKNFGKI